MVSGVVDRVIFGVEKCLAVDECLAVSVDVSEITYGERVGVKVTWVVHLDDMGGTLGWVGWYTRPSSL